MASSCVVADPDTEGATMSIFTASVQYNDLKGTAAADISDTEHLSRYLAGKGLIAVDEYIMSVRFCFHGNHGDAVDRPCVVIYVASLTDADKPRRIRAIEPDMGLAELFQFFKRFDVVLTVGGEQWPDEVVEYSRDAELEFGA